ncbi:MAG TPA: isoprenylcysteine carboxylmethyltransferase family protein [Gemmatimonadales bacterium]|nr:isoprenylcysteine carboxylmethyltransferase family protein [Gemmatimonadales bacterium]
MLLGAAFVVPIAAFYRVRSRTSERLDRKQEGLFLLLGIRLVGLLTIGSLIAFLIDPTSMAWSAVPIPLWARWAGVAIAAAAASLWLYTFHHLGRNLTDTVVTRREHSLVTRGPYAYVRHPFYVAVALLVIANALTTANWFILASGLTLFSLLVIRTDIEEAKLVERFGHEYLDYMRNTGRFFPKGWS